MDGRDLRGAGPFEGIDPEAEFDEVVVDGLVRALNDEDVAAANVLEDADENVSFAEDLGFAAGQGNADLCGRSSSASRKLPLPAKILSSP